MRNPFERALTSFDAAVMKPVEYQSVRSELHGNRLGPKSRTCLYLKEGVRGFLRSEAPVVKRLSQEVVEFLEDLLLFHLVQIPMDLSLEDRPVRTAGVELRHEKIVVGLLKVVEERLAADSRHAGAFLVGSCPQGFVQVLIQ